MSKKKIALCVVKNAAEVLLSNGIVVFPTETVYGIGCKYGDQGARQRIYKIKSRSIDKPLQVLIDNAQRLNDFDIALPSRAQVVIDKFTPGAMTFILASASGEKIGFRIPDSEELKDLITAAGGALEASSANISGETPPIDFNQINPEIIKQADLAIDGGKCTGGKESTVVDLSVSPFVILREGAIKAQAILKLVNRE